MNTLPKGMFRVFFDQFLTPHSSFLIRASAREKFAYLLFCLIDDLAVDDGGVGFTADVGQGVLSPDDHIAVLVHLQAAHPASNAEDRKSTRLNSSHLR